MYHSTKALISKSNLIHNYRTIREYIDRKDEKVEMICVVKADAYGHGSDLCTKILYDEGARFFAVSNLDEAIEVRKNIPADAKILILGYTSPSHAKILSEYNIIQTVYSLDYAKKLSAGLEGDLAVHIKIDTGMNRLGFAPDIGGVLEIDAALRLPHLKADGIFTHFARADEDNDVFSDEQYSKFRYVVDRLKEKGHVFRYRHVCNSAALVKHPDMYLDAVRCGIILYGLSPSDCVADIGLRPVMSIISSISHIHDMKKGEAISYGGTYVAEKDVRVATIPIGYADGFVRAYASSYVIVNGKKAPILGRICMDQCMADVSEIECSPGDTVTIIGSERDANALAKSADTIGYEATCLIGKRVPRELAD